MTVSAESAATGISNSTPVSKSVSTRRSLAFSFLDRYASLVIGIVSSMFLARLLTPSEVGAYAVAMVLLSLVATIRDLGVGQYLVLEKELTTDHIRAVWAVQLGFGILLSCVIFGMSAPLARFYGEPAIQSILTVLAVSYLINPLGSITYAWLIREMRFEAIAVMRFSSTTSGALVSVYLAWRGHGPISLAWGGIVSTSVNALIATIFRPRNYPWLPGVRELRRVLSLGAKITSSSMLNTLYEGAPEFLVGKFQSLTAVGFYSRANGLVAMFNRLITDAVQTVALSLFAKERRETGKFNSAFVTSIAYMTALSYSFGLFIALLAFPIVRVLYGTQWDSSVDLARMLCLGIAVGSPVPMCIAGLMAVDQATRVMRLTLVSTALGITLCALAAPHGNLTLGAAIVLNTTISTTLWLRAARGCIGLTWHDFRKTMFRSLLVAATSAIGPAAVVVVFGLRPHSPLPVLCLAVAVCVVGFVAGAYVSGHPIVSELERLRQRIRQLRPTT